MFRDVLLLFQANGKCCSILPILFEGRKANVSVPNFSQLISIGPRANRFKLSVEHRIRFKHYCYHYIHKKLRNGFRMNNCIKYLRSQIKSMLITYLICEVNKIMNFYVPAHNPRLKNEKLTHWNSCAPCMSKRPGDLFFNFAVKAVEIVVYLFTLLILFQT